MKANERHINEATALVKDPLFLYRVGKKIGELGLIGDVRNALIIFLAGLTIYIEDKVSVLAAGPSGAGKSTRIEKPLMLFPSKSVIRRASLSRKAVAYGEGSLDKKILYINEYQGGKEARLMLRIAQSEGAISHEYTLRGRTHVIERIGSPVVLTTTSEHNVYEDDATRVLTLNIEHTPDQILAVMKASLHPDLERNEPGLKVWREAIRMVGNRANKPFTLPSWLEYIAEQVPRDQPRSMRDWKRFIAFMKVICLCRPQSGSNNEISLADYCVAYLVLNPVLTATRHAVSEQELNVQKAVSKLKKKMRRAITCRHNDRFQEYMDRFLPQWRLYREELNRSPLAHESWSY